jgi:hypothetical protein
MDRFVPRDDCKQALMQARKLEATTPYNLEIQNFIANRLCALLSSS